MLIFIPLCSVVYALVREDVNRRLKRRCPGEYKDSRPAADEKRF